MRISGHCAKTPSYVYRCIGRSVVLVLAMGRLRPMPLWCAKAYHPRFYLFQAPKDMDGAPSRTMTNVRDDFYPIVLFNQAHR